MNSGSLLARRCIEEAGRSQFRAAMRPRTDLFTRLLGLRKARAAG